MDEGRGYMIAGYVLTVLVLVLYAVRLGLRARSARRRLETARPANAHRLAAEGNRAVIEVGGTHVQA